MRYRTLLSIAVKHEYYIDEKCDDLEFIPSEDCLLFLKNHRIKINRTPSTLELVQPVDEMEAPFIPLESGAIARFYIQVNHPDFFHFTKDFSEVIISDLGQPLPLEKAAFKQWCFPRYSNENLSAAETQLPMEIYRHIRQERFAVQIPKLSDYFFLKGAPVPGRTKADFTLKELDCASLGIEQYDETMKRVKINTLVCPPGKEFTLSYWALPPWPKFVFGLADIFIKPTEPLGKNYTIQLSSQKARWKYYVVAESEDLSIQGPIPFPPPVTANDETGTLLKTTFPGSKVKLFTSNTELTYKEAITKGIQLKQGDQIKLSNLPNPSPSSRGVEIVNIFQTTT